MNTLEQRLHDVAKRFVARPNAGQQPPQPGAPPGGVLQGTQMAQNGLQQPVAPPGQMPGMMNVPMQNMAQFQNGMQQPMQAQQGFMPNNGAMTANMGLQDPLRNQMAQVPGQNMVATQPMQQLDPANQYPLMGANNTAFNAGAPMPQGVMSNGAPVLIRGQRDWNAQPTQPMLGVSFPKFWNVTISH